MEEDYFSSTCSCYTLPRVSLKHTWHNEKCLRFDYMAEIVFLDKLVSERIQRVMELSEELINKDAYVSRKTQ